jgi:serine/threonine-protein kinase HipA
LFVLAGKVCFKYVACLGSSMKQFRLSKTDEDNALDLDLALQVAEFFRLSEKRALEIILDVKTAVGNWRTVANKYGIPRSEQELKRMAFRMAEE